MFFGRRSPRRNEESVLAAQREQANQVKMPPRVSAAGVDALTTSPTAQPVELELASLADGDVKVKILIDQIILVAQNNNDKSELLSKIVGQMLQDFKENIDGLQNSVEQSDQDAAAAAAATEALRVETNGLDADKQAKIATLSEELKSNMELVNQGNKDAADNAHKYRIDLSLLQGQCDNLSDQCEGKDKNLQTTAEKITQLEQELNRMTAVGQEEKGKIADIRTELDKAILNHRHALADLRESLNAATVESGAKQEELNMAKSAAVNTERHLEELSNANNLTREENYRMRSENEELLVKISAVNEEVSRLARIAAEAERAAALAQQEVGTEKAKCNQMAAEINKLNKALETMRDSGVKLGNIGNMIGKNADASDVTKDLLKKMDALNKRLKGASGGGHKKTRKKKNKKKRNSTKRIVFKTKKLNKKTRIKKVKKMNKKPAKKLTRKRK